MVTQLLRLHCGACLVQSYCKESNFLYKLAEISFFIMFNQNLVKCMTSSIGLFAHFKNLNISGKKRYLKIENSIFLLIYLFMYLNGFDRKEAIFVIVPLYKKHGKCFLFLIHCTAWKKYWILHVACCSNVQTTCMSTFHKAHMANNLPMMYSSRNEERGHWSRDETP